MSGDVPATTAATACPRRESGTPTDADAIKAHVRERLAGYKVPRHVMIAESVERAVTGKADYNAVRSRILEWLATKG